MRTHSAYLQVLIALLLAPVLVAGQEVLTEKSPAPIPLEAKTLSGNQLEFQNNEIAFKQASESPDTTKATLRVKVIDKDRRTEPIQGATVLLRRDDDKMLGRVTKYDGKCLFSASPASYTVRVQMTGLKTVEQSGFVLNAGQVYDMEIRMGKN